MSSQGTFFETLFMLKPKPSDDTDVKPIWFASVGGTIVELTTDEIYSRRAFFKARTLAGAHSPAAIPESNEQWRRFVDARFRGDLVELKYSGMTFDQALSAVRAQNHAQLRRVVIDGPSKQYTRFLRVHEVPR